MVLVDNSTIFISHSSSNVEIVQHFCTALNSIGIEAQKIFCSSIPGQGVENGQKLNEKIFDALTSSKLLIYFISDAFIKSPYCMEELGVGWYLAESKKAECFLLRIPDVNWDEIGGFVNSNIDKITVLDENHKDDFGVLLEQILEKLDMPTPKHSVFLNIERVFWNSVSTLIKNAILSRNNKSQQEKERLAREKAQANRISSLEEKLKECRIKLNQKEELSEEKKLRIEFDTIIERFAFLGYGEGISNAIYKTLYKDFLFSMIYRYIELEKKFCAKKDCMEILAASVFSHEGMLSEAYEHLIKYVQYCQTGIYPDFYRNVGISKDNDMHEIIELLEEKSRHCRPGVVLDAYQKTINSLKERKQKLGRTLPHA